MKIDQRYWTDIEEFRENLKSGISRRSFIELLGLSFVSLSCTKFRMPVEKIIPAVNKTSFTPAGQSLYYASTCGGCNSGCGTLVKVRDGRPIKLEGNPAHPINSGGLCALGHASLLNLYGKNRARDPQSTLSKSGWNIIDSKVTEGLRRISSGGKKIILLSNTINSPSTLSLLDDFKRVYPTFKYIFFEPFSLYSIREANMATFGYREIPSYNFDKADIILSFDADFLGAFVSPVEHTKQYATFKDRMKDVSGLKHIQFESRFSLTGASANERILISPTTIENNLLFLGRTIEKILNYKTLLPESSGISNSIANKIYKLADTLTEKRGKSLIVSGVNDKSIQILTNYINYILGNYENTLSLKRTSNQNRADDPQMDSLAEEMNKGEVGALLIYRANPSFTYRNAESFNTALLQVDLSISFSDIMDETAKRVKYLCPSGHYTERWDDFNPETSIYSVSQPSITPLYNTRSLQDSLLSWMGNKISYYDYLKNHWKERFFNRQSEFSNFETFWENTLKRGFIKIDDEQNKSIAFNNGSLRERFSGEKKTESKTLELYQSPQLRDLLYARNPYLLELPDPISKISWSDYALISPFLAKKMALRDGQYIRVNTGNKEFKIPVRIQPGQDKNTISAPLGYGMVDPLNKENKIGTNLFSHLSYNLESGTKYFVENISITPLSEFKKFALSQTEDILHDRPIVLDERASAHKKEHAGEDHNLEKLALWKGHKFKGHKWELIVDLNKCTGCSACVVSCAVENNIPFVGEDEVRRKRDMYWMRIDRYYKGGRDNPALRFQPMFCQQCNNAPCESVCPVLATVQSSEGLNMQAYNRCVGTRFCANNCPYKTRRFNWFEYARDEYALPLSLNPDVTVRSRGVMEKCTFCIQRIEEIKIRSKKEKREIKDGEIKTACEESCPSGAIIFGDANDTDGRIYAYKNDKRNFQVLEELYTKPSVMYQKRII